MLEAGHRVSLVLCDFPHWNKVQPLSGVKVYFFSIKTEIIILAAISRYVLKASLYDLLCARLGLIRNLEKRIRDIICQDQVDLIYCENFLTAIPVGNVIRGIPIVVSAIDVMTDNFIQKAEVYRTPKFFINFAQGHYEKAQLQGLQNADVCVCMTQNDAERFHELGFPKERLFVIPQGTYTSKVVPSPKNHELLKRLGIKGSDPVLFFCGVKAFNNNKTAENIIKIVLPRIVEHLPMVKVLFVGGVCDYIRKSGLHSQYRENIILVGRVEDIIPYYSLYDIYLLPMTHATGIQSKVADALAVGKPIICTSKAAAGYEVMNGRDIIIEDRIEDYHLHILDLLQNLEKAKTLGENARHVSLRYDWQALMAKYNEICELIMMNHS